jgi:hypothetical protein
MSRALFSALFVLLGATTFDNLSETVGWGEFLSATGLDALPARLVDSLALAAFGGLFLLPFLGAIYVAVRWTGSSEPLGAVARRFGWSLIPIAVAYVLAHNAPLLMTGVPRLIQNLADPFQMGWNITGTATLFSGYSPSPRAVWFVEIFLIVGGHILGVLAAHRAAVRMVPAHGAAVRSQYALTVLMTVYTVTTLWLLAQPLVA